jgi:hypothetical protein
MTARVASVPARGHLVYMPVVRVLYGLTLLILPHRLLSAAGLRDDARACFFARVLGMRHLAEVALVPRGSRTGAAIDAIHAASALGWAALDRTHRRGLLANAAIAAALASAAAGAARR